MFSKPSASEVCKNIIINATEIFNEIKNSENIDSFTDKLLSWTTPVTDDYLYGNLEGIELLVEKVEELFIDIAQNTPENELILKNYHDLLIDAKNILRERNPGRNVGHKPKKS